MPLSRQELDRELGKFSFVELQEGKLKLDQDWVGANLVYVDSPWALPLGWGGYARRIRCHRRVAAQLLAALEELRDEGLMHLVKDYWGAWNPRKVRGGSSPSPHCWGHAIDLNARDFPLGSEEKQDPQLVAVMAGHGFECGQEWHHRKDPMHFEAIRFSVAESAPESSVGQVAIVVGNARVGTGRLEEGRVVGHLAPVIEALGHKVTWDAGGRRLLIE